MSAGPSPKRPKTEFPQGDIEYLPGQGMGNLGQSECLEGALPEVGNTPQKCPYGLYAEQLSGTAFTAPRAKNQRSWMYRMRPSAAHGDYSDCTEAFPAFTAPWTEVKPDQFRWLANDVEEGKEQDWVQGMTCYGGAGDPTTRHGMAIYTYVANAPMKQKSFQSSDGDMLIVVQQGVHEITTEFGKLRVFPQEIAVLPRGVRFSIEEYEGGVMRGYVVEVFDGHFTIPDLGPIGANGLANPHDFKLPMAAYHASAAQDEEEWTVFHKFGHKMFHFPQNHSPYDVVAWRGNYVPYKYNLKLFCTVNSVSYDHMDPCIFTVLTCQTESPGVAALDFVIFPPRWGVAEDTFRPPYYHKNCMTEFMGLVAGNYEAKPQGAPDGKKGFGPGGATLHSHMTAHGPAAGVFEKASNAELKPERVGEGSMAFMFESHYTMKLTRWAVENCDPSYRRCWEGFKVHFDPARK